MGQKMEFTIPVPDRVVERLAGRRRGVPDCDAPVTEVRTDEVSVALLDVTAAGDGR